MLEETAEVLLSLSNKSAPGSQPDGYPRRGPASPAKLSISFLLDGPSSDDTNTDREDLLSSTTAQKSPSTKKRTHDNFESDKQVQSASLPSKKPRPDVQNLPSAPPVPSLPLELVLALQLGILPAAVSSDHLQQAPLTPSPMILSTYLPMPYIQGPHIQMLPMPAQQLPRYQPIRPNAHLASSSPASSSHPSSPVTQTTGTSSVTTRREKSSTSEDTAEATEPNGDNSDSSPSEPSDRSQVVDTQQHTQQLLRQWHRQRQVQKLLYIQKKSQKKQKSDVSSPTSNGGSPALKPTFTWAAAGSPSSLTPETLMALVEDLLARHVGPEVHASDRRKSTQKNNEKERGKRRHRVPPEHLQVLEKIFAAEPFPHAEAKMRLAERLGMTKRGITIWFQNKRARLKRNDEELKAAKASQQEGASGTGRKSDGIVFHQLTVDNEGQLTIIPEYPLE